MQRMTSAIVGLAFSTLVWTPATAQEPAPKPVIVLQPLGEISAKDIATAKAGILAVYDVEVRVVKKVPLPKAAYYPPRDRYRAEKLLDFLDDDLTLDFTPAKIIGLTAVDISTTKGDKKDWGIMGLGDLGGTCCVVSTFRLGAHKATAEKRAQRLIKVSTHELGHTFGLEHCPAEHCLMEDAQGTILTMDAEDGSFCHTCRGHLGQTLKQPQP